MATPVYNQQPYVKNRPCSRKDAQGNVIPSTFTDLAFQGIYDDSNNLIYKGFARVGSITFAASVWQIAQLNYDDSNNLISVLWPQDSNSNASSEYEFIFDDYTDYTYS